jgi:hypothetical protein
MRSKFIIVFAVATTIFLGGFLRVKAADIFVTPALGNYTIGQNFSVSIFVSSPGQAMNAASGILSFPPDELEVMSISKANTIMSLWVQEPTFSNQAGTVNFEGVVLNPGFTGANAKVLTVNFRAKGYGLADVSFSSASILANDGNGTNILKTIDGGHYNVNITAQNPSNANVTTPSIASNSPPAPKITSDTHPDPNMWYSKTTARFNWGPLPEGITGVRTLMDKSASSLPNVLNSSQAETKEVTDLSDGVWYFHVQFRNKNGWGSISHFKVGIDATPPAPISIVFLSGRESSDPRPVISFTTYDSPSGIEKYQAKIGDGDFFDVPDSAVTANSFVLPRQLPGKHTLLIQAIDKADNKTTGYADFNILPIDSPKITSYSDSLQSGDFLSLEGTTYPDSSVYVFVAKNGQDAERHVVRSDQTGMFTLIWPKILDVGKYVLYAQVSDKRGAVSENSIIKGVTVSQGVLIQLGPIKTNNIYVGLLILALFFVSLIGGIYGWYINFRYGHGLHKYVRKQGFTDLKKKN